MDFLAISIRMYYKWSVNHLPPTFSHHTVKQKNPEKNSGDDNISVDVMVTHP